MSKDTIYRQDAIDACIRVQEHHAYDEIEEIKALPPADVQPVVRCPDCEYWDEQQIRCNKHKDSMMYGIHDFCSKGKWKGVDNG